MTKTELTEIIRKLVSEEVKNQFPHLINEILGKGSQTVQQPQPRPVQQKIIPKTGNPELDRVLEQTAPRMSRPHQPVQNRQPLVQLENPFSMSNFQAPQTSYYDQEPIMESMDEIQAEELPDFLSKNYAGFMKSVDKKVKQQRGANGPL